jgi:hypothetical protein
MSNVNTTAGLYNIPRKLIPVTTAFLVFTVPAAGLYAGYPSPTLPVGSALSVGLSDIDGSQSFDGRPFKIRISGEALGIATSTLTLTLGQNTLANVGQIGAAAPVTAAGVKGTGFNVLATPFSALTLGALSVKFHSEVLCLWSSVSDRLATAHFSVSALSNASILPSPPVWAASSAVAVTAITDLNFVLAASIDTAADATTYVQINEFSIERV